MSCTEIANGSEKRGPSSLGSLQGSIVLIALVNIIFLSPVKADQNGIQRNTIPALPEILTLVDWY